MKKAGISLPFANYLDICCKDDDVFEFIIDYIKGIPEKYNIDYVEIRLMAHAKVDTKRNPDTTQIRCNSNNYTFILPLERNEEQVMSLSTGSNRNHTRKTYKNDWFSVSVDACQLEAFYTVYCKTVKRLGSPAPALDFFKNIRTKFPDDTTILTVSDNDTHCVVGGMFLFLWKDTLYYYWGGALPEYNKKYINNFMYWEAVKFSISKGFKLLDLGRSAFGSGTYNFKEQWGAQPVQLKYYHFGREHDMKAADNKHIEIKKDDFGMLISMWKHTPDFVTDFVGKRLIKYIMP